MKTAEQWSQEGEALEHDGKHAEAIQCFDQAIALDSHDPKHHLFKADSLVKLGKFEEANTCYDKVLSIDPNYMLAYRGKFKALLGLGKPEETIQLCDQVLAIDPTYHAAYYNKGKAQREMGKNKDALATYDKATSVDPKWAFPYTGKGHVYAYLCKYEEAIGAYEKAMSLDRTDAAPISGKAQVLSSLARYSEAIDCYNKLILLVPNSAVYLCNRGKLLSAIGKTSAALDDFKQAREIVLSGHNDVELSPENMEFLKITLKSIIELDEIAKQTASVIDSFGEDNPRVKKFVDNIRVLQEDKQRVIANLIAKFDQIDAEEDEDVIYDRKRTLEGPKRKTVMINSPQKKKQTGFVSQQKSAGGNIDEQIAGIKQELEKEFDYYSAKIDAFIENSGLPAEEQNTLKKYVRGFAETFFNIYVTSEVVYNGETQVEADESKTIMLSTLASLVPFIEKLKLEALEELILSKEMKSYARKIKGLAPTPLELATLIGKVAMEIVRDSAKQKKIITVTSEELKKASDVLLENIEKFCHGSVEIDVYLYTRLFKAPSSRLGHIEANSLIHDWINVKVDPYNPERDFVKKIIGHEATKKAIAASSISEVNVGVSDKTNSCSMF